MKTFIIIGLLVTLAGCNSQKTASKQAYTEPIQLENTYWTLIEFDGKPTPASVEGKVHLQLSDEDKTLSGSNGCNRLMGSYEISNGVHLSFSKNATTRMACQLNGWDEMKFNQALGSISNFTISGNRLMLNTETKAPIAIFEATPL